jgi:hypothetical protein
MAIRVDTGISLRSEYGVTLGRLHKVSDKQLLVAANSKFRPGAKVEFQLELPSYGATVYGIAQVTRVTAFADAPSRYLMAITQLSTKDRSLFQQWIYELAQIGGAPSTSSAVVSSIVSTLGDRPPPRSDPGSQPAARWSTNPSEDQGRQNVGRAAVREALRARFAGRGRTTPAEPPDASTETAGRYSMDASTLSHTRSASAAANRPTPRPVRSAEAAAAFSSQIHRARGTTSRTAGGGDITITTSPDAERQFSSRPDAAPSIGTVASTTGSTSPRPKRLEIVLALDKRPPLVSLRYNSTTRFLSDFADYLSKDAAFVRWAGTKPNHRSELAIEMMLPSGARIACSGQVVAIMPSGFGLSLKLSDDDRQRLADEARVGG